MRTRVIPFAFVLIWSTGFVVARAVVSHASPELFLSIRMLASAALLGAIAVVTREQWPRGRRLGQHVIAGAFLNGVYLCMAYWAVADGMPAGIMSLLGSTQPIVALIAMYCLFGERPSSRNVLGMIVAIAGVACVLSPALLRNGTQGVSLWGVLAGIVAVLGMTAGTLIQRGTISADPVCVAASVQNAGGALVALIATIATGHYSWDNTLPLWAGLAWSVIGLSAAAVLLIVWMVRHQGAAQMSALLPAVPPLAALEAWILFGEKLNAVQLAGFIVALVGVAVARSGAAAQRPGERPSVRKLVSRRS